MRSAFWRDAQCGEGDANQFFASGDVHATVREGRVAPGYIAASSVFAGLEQCGAADFFKPFGREPPEDKFTLIVPDENLIAVLSQESVGKQTGLAADGGVSLP